MWRNVLLWKENIRESRKRIRHRLVRSSGSSRTDWTMWVVQPDEDGDGQMNPDITHPPSKVQCPDVLTVKGEVLVGECGGTRQLTT